MKKIEIVKRYTIYQNAAEVDREFQIRSDRALQHQKMFSVSYESFTKPEVSKINLHQVGLGLLAPMRIENVFVRLLKEVLQLQ